MNDSAPYERIPENRGWVLDPAGHRHLATGGEIRQTGEQVDTPFGKATLIVMPVPDNLSDWICDFCNQTILTMWGNEPWPVAMVGNSYALCNDCRLDYEHEPATGVDEEEIIVINLQGEELVLLEGSWPFSLCTCAACYLQATIWRSFIEPFMWQNRAKMAKQN